MILKLKIMKMILPIKLKKQNINYKKTNYFKKK